MAQINHVFGNSLEFSTTVVDGKIQSQELVSSNDDCIISFKLDRNFLCPKVLRDLANKIDKEKGVKLVLASKEQSSAYIAKTKEYGGVVAELFSASTTAASLAIAEYMANVDGFTMYESRVTPVVEEVWNGEDHEEEEEEENDGFFWYDDDEDDYEDEYDEEDQWAGEEGYKTL